MKNNYYHPTCELYRDDAVSIYRIVSCSTFIAAPPYTIIFVPFLRQKKKLSECLF